MKHISILGSTGSIGTQALEIVRAFPDDFCIIGLSAGKNTTLLKQQILDFKPKLVAIADDTQRDDLIDFVRINGLTTRVETEKKGLHRVATHPDNQLLIVAIVGTAALEPTYLAIQNNIPIGLASKEVLVAAGDIIMSLAKNNGVPILPIDSEHAALKQCLASVYEDPSSVNRLILTASGGPFYNTPLEEFPTITKAQALKHPNWEMGAKITIDSATMMNKGLEVIEAHHLFNMSYDNIDVIIHPQSIIHSMVEFNDGTIISQMGLPDMRFPIQYVMSYPRKLPNPWPKTNLAELSSLTFSEPDKNKFPLLELAYEAGKMGGSAPVVLNAANEAAVKLFLDDKIRFIDIPRLIEEKLNSHPHQLDPSLDDIIAIDVDVKHQFEGAYA